MLKPGTLVIGVDPGSISAAYALLVVGAPEAVWIGDMPAAAKMMQAAAWAQALREQIKPFKDVVAIVENVHAFPKQGVSSSFNFGVGFGMIQGALAALEIQTHLVAPTVWKRSLGLNHDKDKSREVASRLYPTVAQYLTKKRDGNKAEALLMAHHYVWKFAGQDNAEGQ